MKMKNKETKKLKAADFITTAVFVVFTFGFAAATVISHDREFSEMENRNLAQKPDVSLTNIKDGKFTSDLESYISDQLFFKDKLVSLKVDCDRLLQKNYQNGVYFCANNSLMQKYEENLSQIDKNVGYINDWAEKINCPIDFILVPNAVSVLETRLPANAVNDHQQESIKHISETISDKITLYNPNDALLQATRAGTEPFYHTDHHWTSGGAKAVFDWYMQKSEQKILPVDYDVNSIDNFYGTLYSKAPSGLLKGENIDFYSNPKGEYSVEYVSEKKVTDTLYDSSFFDKKDKYAAFFGGNFSQVRIKSNAESDEKVLILKDSYANIITPFFADQYSEITMIDMRYYHFEEHTVSELIVLYDIDRVIMVYNMDFVNSDQNFVWLE